MTDQQRLDGLQKLIDSGEEIKLAVSKQTGNYNITISGMTTYRATDFGQAIDQALTKRGISCGT